MAHSAEVVAHSRALAESLTAKGFICIPTAFKCPLPKAWQKLEKTYSLTGSGWQKCNGVGMLTGKKTGIVVVDVDQPDREWFDQFWEHYKLPPTTRVLTPGGGYHLYYKYTPLLKNGKYKGFDIDIRGDGGQIIAPGSYYYTKKAEKVKHNGKQYTFAPGCDFSVMSELPDELLRLQQMDIDRKTFEFSGRRRRTNKKVVMAPIRRACGEHVFKDNQDPDNRRILLELLRQYSKSCVTRVGYDEWLKAIWAVCGEAVREKFDPISVLDEWSKGQPSYEGPEVIMKKCKEYNPTIKRMDLSFFFNQDNKDLRKQYRRVFSYEDYMYILAKSDPHCILADVQDYLRTAFVRVDRMSHVLYYLKKRDGTWHPSGMPFKGDNNHPFFHAVINPEYKPETRAVSKFIMEKESLHSILAQNQLTLVPNYSDLQYMPFHGVEDPCPYWCFNVFTGYKHAELSKKEYAVAAQSPDFQFMMNHWLETMCSGNKEFFEYTMNWLSYLLRFGYKKPRVAIVMHGEEGLGKGLMWVDLVYKGVIGEGYGHVVTDMARFTEKFNMQRLNKSIHIFNECTSLKSGSKVSWDKMKAIVTDRDIIAEPKGKESFQAIDCAGCVMTGNHKHLVSVSNDDRRYASIEMSSKHKGDVKYFDKLAKIVEDPFVQQTFFTMLVNRDISKYNMTVIPKTESRMHMKTCRNENYILHFLRKLVTGKLGNSCKTQCADYDRFFDMQTNDEMEEKSKGRAHHLCYYRKDNILNCFFKAYLPSENVPQRYYGSRHQLAKELKSKGLPYGKKTDRSVYAKEGMQCECFLISRESIKNLHRRWLNEPNWEYPAEPPMAEPPSPEPHVLFPDAKQTPENMTL